MQLNCFFVNISAEGRVAPLDTGMDFNFIPVFLPTMSRGMFVFIINQIKSPNHALLVQNTLE